MLNGVAFMVVHPRRREQDYVSLDPVYVAKDILSTHHVGWNVRVEMISFRGEGALCITTNVHDIIMHLPEGQKLFRVSEGVLHNH